MARLRRCDSRCHDAKGTKCGCWCGGFYHGTAGAGNRADLTNGTKDILYQPGFKQGETVYLGQIALPFGKENST
jgi:hypothetical protein